MDIDYNMKKEIEGIVKYTINPMTMEEDDIINVIDDLIYEYHNLKEEHEKLKQDLEDNYRPIPVAEQVGISDKDFI